MSMELGVVAAVTIFIVMQVAFIFAVRFKRNDIADVVWGPGFVIVALSVIFWRLFVLHDFVWDLRNSSTLGLLVLWALRLSWHIGFRNLSHSVEDARYKKWREEWGEHWILRSYLQVFLLQGLLLLLIAIPVIWVMASPSQEADGFFYAGLFVWVGGFVIESVADHQLKLFKARKKPSGSIMNEGLWSWSRHPNYFGEVVQWWGFFLLAVALPSGLFTVISPIAITFLILKVSGVPLLEKQMENRPGFAEYKRRTSVFVLWPPRK